MGGERDHYRIFELGVNTTSGAPSMNRFLIHGWDTTIPSPPTAASLTSRAPSLRLFSGARVGRHNRSPTVPLFHSWQRRQLPLPLHRLVPVSYTHLTLP